MKILLAEDNSLLGRSIKQGLEEIGWIVDLAPDGEEALYMGKNSNYQVLLIDRMLPGISGPEVLRRLRESDVVTPAIIISARGSLDDRISGLEVSEDYLVKPFQMAELIARVKAIHRCSLGKGNSELLMADLRVNLSQRSSFIGPTRLPLTTKEFDLLETLATQKDQVCKRDSLIQLLYGFNEEPESNSIDVILARLRKKIKGSGVKISTIRSKGFILHVE